MQITEPLTMLTDYALGAADLLFAVSLFSAIHPKNRVTALLLGLGFLAGAVSGFAGGTFHGFALHFQEAGLRRVWNTTLLSIGATAAFLGSGVHAADVRKENGKCIAAALLLTLMGLGIQATGFRSRRFFNHNDIFHVMQTTSMCLFFRGARRLEDRAYSPK